jgi:hypothetical protein
MDGALEPWRRVVSAPGLASRRSVVTEGDDSQQTGLGGVRSCGLQPRGQLRAAAPRRALDPGPQGPAPGRPQADDGQVNWSDRSRFATVETAADPLGLSHQGLHHGPCPCHLGVGVVVDTPRHRRAVLLRPDVALDAPTRSRDDKARCPLEVWGRDAKPWAGLSDGQARSQAHRAVHFKARWACEPGQARSPSTERAGGIVICQGEAQTACRQSASDRPPLCALSQRASLGHLPSRVRHAGSRWPHDRMGSLNSA